MQTRLLLELVIRRFGEYSKVGDEVQVNCPFCEMLGHTPNTTRKLYINIRKELYNCFRCGVRGRLGNLFPQLVAASVSSQDVINKLDSDREKLESLPPSTKSLLEIDYPFNELVREFLLDRSYIVEDLSDVCSFCEDYKKKEFSFGPRLIFPIYQFGSYRGFQARTIYKNTDPKYIGATGMDKRSILYNFDKAFSQHERLVITEGFFDCLRVGDTAVATLGKNLTENQLRLIRLGSFDKVFVFLDKDAQKEALQIGKKLSPYFHVYVATPTKKDPGEMTRDEIESVLNDTTLRRIF